MIDLQEYRESVFLSTIEPSIVRLVTFLDIDLEGEAIVSNDHDDDGGGGTIGVGGVGGIDGTNYNGNSNYKRLLDTTGGNGAIQSHSVGGENDPFPVSPSHRRLGVNDYVKGLEKQRDTKLSFKAIATLFIIMSCIAGIFLSCFYHNQKTSPLFISPRRHRLPKLVPPPLPVDGALQWIKVCFLMSDEEIIARVGYDSLIFLRFHRLALRCIVKMSAFSFVVLLPLNYLGNGHANADNIKETFSSIFRTNIFRFTMVNIKSASPILWIHCFAAYLLTGIVVRELLIEYEASQQIGSETVNPQNW